MASVKLIFASDLAPIRRFADMMAKTPEKIYGDLLPQFRKADYRIVNLESPLTSVTEYITKSGAAFSGRPEHISSLKAAGFQAAVCANNHAFDCGEKGFFETKNLLESHGIACLGAGRNIREAVKPLSLTLNGVKIAIFAISEGEDRMGASAGKAGVAPWQVEELARRIRAARRSYDAVLVSAHCGLEYQPYPSFYVYQAFRKWAEAGASLMIGHHPHVPQGMTVFGTTPAYFSLGNFAFYQATDLFYRKIGYFLEMELDQSGILSHRPVPYRIAGDGLHLLAGSDVSEFEQLFVELSTPLRDERDALKAWHAVLAVNGREGFCRELEKILAALRETPEKGAAMLRNRVNCMQHLTQWGDGMTRIMDGTIQDAPPEYTALVRKYLTRTLGDER